MTPTQAQIEAAVAAYYAGTGTTTTRIIAALTAAAEVRPADISCPFCGGENGQHDHNCGLKKTAAAADPALRDFIKDTPISEPNNGWAAEQTKPTQAQIEASYVEGWRDCSQGRCDKYAALTAAAEVDPALRDSAMARVAALIEPLHEAITDYAKARNNLIAAAGVGGQKPDQIQIDKAMTEYERGIESATIERCACVALEQRCERNTPWDRACVAIAAAIRALKDKL